MTVPAANRTNQQTDTKEELSAREPLYLVCDVHNCKLELSMCHANDCVYYYKIIGVSPTTFQGPYGP
jgi:hypothetical protein